MNTRKMIEDFCRTAGAYKVSAAGRVNIIGEHVDYCGGKVLPAALSLCNTVYIKPNGTDKINIAWTTLDKYVTLDIAKLGEYRSLEYGDYQAGSLYFWQQAGFPVVGCDMVQDCSVPFGSGLSSSAAIEVSTIAAMCAVTGIPFDKVRIAVEARRAESEYIGVNCGIMDQYASACGKAGNAMLLDCATLISEYVPIDTGDCSIVIINCNKPHSLVESKYNERREETDEALRLLKMRLDINCLAELDTVSLEKNMDILPQVIYKRTKHVVEECARVNRAVESLRSGDMATLGILLNESHASLRDLYEVTGRELDALSDAARKHPACLGSRMTGGGFGGCTVSLVKTDGLKDFKRIVLRDYERATGYIADVYETSVCDGIVVEKLS